MTKVMHNWHDTGVSVKVILQCSKPTPTVSPKKQDLLKMLFKYLISQSKVQAAALASAVQQRSAEPAQISIILKLEILTS